MTEKSAKDVQGYLLWDENGGKYFFRVYKGTGYKDYELCAEDIKITINSRRLSLYESEEENILGWASR